MSLLSPLLADPFRRESITYATLLHGITSSDFQVNAQVFENMVRSTIRVADPA
jgi:hypothetical protein